VDARRRPRTTASAPTPEPAVVGASARNAFAVTDDDTAIAVGSGSLPVLGTPRLLAWCESVTCAAVADTLPAGSTSVGTRVELSHRAPSPVGATVTVEATVAAVEGRTVLFDVRASHEDGTEVAVGTVTRAVVDAEQFVSRLR
jgi:predicted thioesterase